MTSLEEIQARLLKLEKQNRRVKQLGATTLIIPALLLVMGQAAPVAMGQSNIDSWMSRKSS